MALGEIRVPPLAQDSELDDAESDAKPTYEDLEHTLSVLRRKLGDTQVELDTVRRAFLHLADRVIAGRPPARGVVELLRQHPNVFDYDDD